MNQIFYIFKLLKTSNLDIGSVIRLKMEWSLPVIYKFH